MSVTWLHISDFHLREGCPYGQDVVLRSLVKSVKRFREEEGRTPDLIFATGDVVQAGKAGEYGVATRFFDDLLEAAGLTAQRDRLFIVPGNHDVEQKRGLGLVRTLQGAEDADEYFDPHAPMHHMSDKLAAFAAWYNGYFRAADRMFPKKSTCDVNEITINGSRLAILSLNSTLFCHDDGLDHKKLFIGRRCLDEAKVQLAQLHAIDLAIALIHHPLDWLHRSEEANIHSTLVQTIDLLLQGHDHQPNCEKIERDKGGYLKLAAGAAFQTREYPNTAMYTVFERNRVTITPIHYEDSPDKAWKVDTSRGDASSYSSSFDIPGRP
jgi:predicted MPP superfamily phosphohydrolase